VDPVIELRLSRALSILASGRTTVSIAHRLSTAARADRILLLVEGRVQEDGSHEELVKKGGFYSNLHATWISSTKV
jgi:putative ABC transport system ATP-binding protein